MGMGIGCCGMGAGRDIGADGGGAMRGMGIGIGAGAAGADGRPWVPRWARAGTANAVAKSTAAAAPIHARKRTSRADLSLMAPSLWLPNPNITLLDAASDEVVSCPGGPGNGLSAGQRCGAGNRAVC